MNCQRASDGKKLRYVTRVERGVAHDAPRNTHWSHIHLPLYSPSAPPMARSLIGGVGALRPLPHVAVQLAQRTVSRRSSRRRMEVARIDERAVHGLIARGDFPFGLGGRRAPAHRANASAS